MQVSAEHDSAVTFGSPLMLWMSETLMSVFAPADEPLLPVVPDPRPGRLGSESPPEAVGVGAGRTAAAGEHGDSTDRSGSQEHRLGGH